MTPFRQQLTDIDWKEAGGFLAFLAGLGAILRFLFMPLIAASLRGILKAELEKLHAAVEEIEKCATGMTELREDVEELADIASDNRDWMVETHALLDHMWSIDRREGEGDRRHLPPLPRYPDRRRRPRRDDR